VSRIRAKLPTARTGRNVSVFATFAASQMRRRRSTPPFPAAGFNGSQVEYRGALSDLSPWMLRLRRHSELKRCGILAKVPGIVVVAARKMSAAAAMRLARGQWYAADPQCLCLLGVASRKQAQRRSVGTSPTYTSGRAHRVAHASMAAVSDSSTKKVDWPIMMWSFAPMRTKIASAGESVTAAAGSHAPTCASSVARHTCGHARQSEPRV
jgi:hypothetical protein